jgi:cation transport ATPase
MPNSQEKGYLPPVIAFLHYGLGSALLATFAMYTGSFLQSIWSALIYASLIIYLGGMYGIYRYRGRKNHVKHEKAIMVVGAVGNWIVGITALFTYFFEAARLENKK